MLSADQISAFRSNGFLVVPDVLPRDLLARIRLEYASLMNDLIRDWGLTDLAGAAFEEQLIGAYTAGFDWFQPLDISLPGDRIAEDTPMHFGPAVFDMVRCPAILDLVESLIGPEITSNPIQHVRIKPPAPNLREDEVRAHITATDWHQDRAVGDPSADETDMITVWLAITDATIQNGCLQVQPFGPAETPILPHCPQTQTAIPEGHLDTDAALPLPVPAGGVVLFHPLVPHASLPNRSDGIRWSFDLRYNRTGQPTGRKHFPDFIVRSRAAPDRALRDWRDWREMWERARSACAQAAHVEIHGRWRSDATYCA